MIHRIFLLTADPEQEARIRAAANRLATECELTVGAVAPAGHSYELLLVDDRLWNRAPAAVRTTPPRVILLASAAAAQPGALQPGVADVIPSIASLGQILLILRQHLGILQLLRLRVRLENEAGQAAGLAGRTPTQGAGPVDIANPLTGILGNAELALASRGRVPPDVRQRLECVRVLAAEIRQRLSSSRRAA